MKKFNAKTIFAATMAAITTMYIQITANAAGVETETSNSARLGKDEHL